MFLVREGLLEEMLGAAREFHRLLMLADIGNRRMLMAIDASDARAIRKIDHSAAMIGVTRQAGELTI